MKVIVLIFVFCCALKYEVCFAQAGEWTWMRGDSTDNAFGIFGTQGIPSSDNNPPGIYEGSDWKDKEGNFWIFGGVTSTGLSSDVWKYDIQTNEWTWMHGSGIMNSQRVIGPIGQFGSSYTPGDQHWCAATWVDTSGMFWLFGGSDADGLSYNMLWEYDPIMNKWAWINGSPVSDDPGSYGVKGIPSATNLPASRWQTTCSWTDKDNNLWLFGGYRTGGTGLFLNDLWKYNIATNEWTWISGSASASQHATYGIKGIADTANVPGARRVSARWTGADGNLWIFGGRGHGLSNAIGDLSDLWRFDLTTNEWTWISGSNQLDDAGNSGPLCQLNTDYFPSARMETKSVWKDVHGNYWLYGGTSVADGMYNDLWVYVPDSNAWSLVGSSIFPYGFYGVQGIATLSTHPPPKKGALSFTDSVGTLWLFSGYYNRRNDLWKYEINLSCPFILYPPETNFGTTGNAICEKFCTNFFDQSINDPASWQWNFPGGAPSSSTDQNPGNICYNTPGIYNVTLITTNAIGSDTLALNNYITVNSTPPFPVITQFGNTLTSSPANSYQWQFNSADIPGETNQSYVAMQTGLYTVVVGDSFSCKNSFTSYVLISGINDIMSDGNISISPNPSNGNFTIEFIGQTATSGQTDNVSIKVVNTVGQIIFSSTESRSIGTGQWKVEIELRSGATYSVPAGIYFIEIKKEHAFAGPGFIRVRQKIVIE